MTAMPEMVGLFNGFGGGASVLVAGAALIAADGRAVPNGEVAGLQMRIATVASALIGSVTFFGSFVAFGKLAEFLAVKWKLYTWQKVIKYGFSLAVAAGGDLVRPDGRRAAPRRRLQAGRHHRHRDHALAAW